MVDYVYFHLIIRIPTRDNNYSQINDSAPFRNKILT